MRTLATAALAGAMLAVGACGGDDDGGSAGALTKPQYIAQADKICGEVEEATQKYAEQVEALPAGSSTDRIGNILENGLDETRKGVARLKALDEPDDGKAMLQAYFASIDKAIATYSDLLTAVSAKDDAKANRLAQQAERLFDEQRTLARRYGFKQCRSL